MASARPRGSNPLLSDNQTGPCESTTICPSTDRRASTLTSTSSCNHVMRHQVPPKALVDQTSNKQYATSAIATSCTACCDTACCDTACCDTACCDTACCDTQRHMTTRHTNTRHLKHTPPQTHATSLHIHTHTTTPIQSQDETYNTPPHTRQRQESNLGGGLVPPGACMQHLVEHTTTAVGQVLVAPAQHLHLVFHCRVALDSCGVRPHPPRAAVSDPLSHKHTR